MAIHKTSPKSRTIRKEATRISLASPDTGMGDSDRVRLSGVQGAESEPTPSRPTNDSLAGAKADFIGRAQLYQSTRGRIPTETNFRFQPIVSNYTHERIRAARQRLKHEPFNPSTDIPKAVGVDLTKIHAHDCGAYEVVKRKRESGQERRKT